MPLRPENRQFYDARWRRFRLALLEAAGHVCQRCAKPHRLLNVAHLTHDPTDRHFLAVLCPSCHSRNDTPQRIAMTRRTRAQRRGQLWLTEELRLAPFPIRTWPAREAARGGYNHEIKAPASPASGDKLTTGDSLPRGRLVSKRGDRGG